MTLLSELQMTVEPIRCLLDITLLSREQLQLSLSMTRGFSIPGLLNANSVLYFSLKTLLLVLLLFEDPLRFLQLA